MKVDLYKIVVECIERGVSYGYMKAHKHQDDPEEDFIKEKICDAVLNELCEYITFNDPVE